VAKTMAIWYVPSQGKSGINTGKHKTIDITRRQSAQNQAAGLLHSKTDWREDHDNG